MNERAKFQQELLASREALMRNKTALIHELDFAAKFKGRVQRNPLLWVGGVAIGVFFIFRLLGRQRKVAEEIQLPKLANPQKTRDLLEELEPRESPRKKKRYFLFRLAWKLGVLLFPLFRSKIETLLRERVTSVVIDRILPKQNSNAK